MADTNFICVPIEASLYNELVLRVGDPNSSVSSYVEYALESFLERTADDGKWSAAYFEWRARQQPEAEFREQYGDPANGYFWTPLFLPNGTKLAMSYGGERFLAEIRHEKIRYENEEVGSPSVLASKIARGTNRNAWLSLMIKRPGDTEFRLADQLRREGARK